MQIYNLILYYFRFFSFEAIVKIVVRNQKNNSTWKKYGNEHVDHNITS